MFDGMEYRLKESRWPDGDNNKEKEKRRENRKQLGRNGREDDLFARFAPFALFARLHCLHVCTVCVFALFASSDLRVASIQLVASLVARFPDPMRHAGLFSLALKITGIVSNIPLAGSEPLTSRD